jgi:hypothetical protein
MSPVAPWIVFIKSTTPQNSLYTQPWVFLILILKCLRELFKQAPAMKADCGHKRIEPALLHL